MMDQLTTPTFLGRQPILDKDSQLLAYELLFRGDPLIAGNAAHIVDPTQATASVIINTFGNLSTKEVLGPFRGFVNVGADFLFSELIEALPPEIIVLEILETVSATPEVIARCKQLKGLGFTLAIDDVINLASTSAELLTVADIIKVDVFEQNPTQLQEAVRQLRPFGKKLLAEKVETEEQFTLCKALGFDLFQGYFFAKPTIIPGKKLTASQQTLLRLLALVIEDAETVAIEQAFKQEPGLTINMLRLTNSVSNGLSTRITSLRHAITLLGRRQLQRWLQLLIFTSSPQTGANRAPLLQLAAMRGRLMELLAARVMPNNREFADQSFMTGIISMMPALLQMPIEEILAQLPVSPRVRAALEEHTGTQGMLLSLAEQTDAQQDEIIEGLLRKLPNLAPKALSTDLANALGWANNLLTESSNR